MRSVRMRVSVSEGPPAADGTINVIGRDGYVCAHAWIGRVVVARAAAANERQRRRVRSLVGSMIISPLVAPPRSGKGIVICSRHDTRLAVALYVRLHFPSGSSSFFFQRGV